jgi:hypothetical protein
MRASRIDVWWRAWQAVHWPIEPSALGRPMEWHEAHPASRAG